MTLIITLFFCLNCLFFAFSIRAEKLKLNSKKVIFLNSNLNLNKTVPAYQKKFKDLKTVGKK